MIGEKAARRGDGAKRYPLSVGDQAADRRLFGKTGCRDKRVNGSAPHVRYPRLSRF